MKAKILLSLGAAAAFACLPITLQTSAASETNQSEPVLSADAFIEKYCLAQDRIQNADGTISASSRWITEVTDENAALLAESRMIFDQLPETTQQIIIQAGKAHQVDYEKLTDQAVRKMEKLTGQEQSGTDPDDSSQPADSTASKTEEPAENPEETPQTPQDNADAKDSGQSGENPADSSSKTEDKTDSKEEQPSTGTEDPSVQENPGQDSSDKDKTPAEDPSKTETPAEDVSGSQTPEDSSNNQTDNQEPDSQDPVNTDQNTQSPADPENTDEGSSADPDQSTDTNADPSAEQTPADDADLWPTEYPSAAGENMSELPVEEVFDANVVEAASQTGAKNAMSYWNLSKASFVLNLKDQSAQSQEYYVLKTLDKQLLFTLSDADNDEILVTTYSPKAYDYNLAAGTLDFKANDSFLIENQITEQPAAQQVSEAAVESETAPSLDKDQTISGLMYQESEASDMSVQSFIDSYCSSNGVIFAVANQYNYQTILDGFSSWSALSASQKEQVNIRLQSAGGRTWQTLFVQANEVRLGMSVTNTPQVSTLQGSVSNKESVNTAADSDKNVLLAAAVLSLFGMCALYKGKQADDLNA